jgi:hypothetical protein
MVVGFKNVITWSRDPFRACDGSWAVMVHWMLHLCGTARQETVEIQAETTRQHSTFYFRFVHQHTLYLPQ